MRWRRDIGSTLFEVIIAFGILTLALSQVLPAFSGLSTSAHQAKTRWAAAEFARSRLEEIGVVDPVREGVLSGSEPSLWTWRIVLTPYQAPDVEIGAGLMEVKMTITPLGGSDPIVSMRTILPAAPEGP